MQSDESQLHRLVDVFLSENKKLNLSAFRTKEHCWIGNVLDSIALLKAFRAFGFGFGSTFIDIGTGGGFPLLPLALCAPDVRCIGIDSVAKKIDAISRIAAAMGLSNVELHCGRIEELARGRKFRESADLVTARAVAPIRVLLEYAVPLLKVGGLCAFWKGSNIADELRSSAHAQKLLHVAFAGIYEYELPGSWGRRLIVFFKKIAATPEKYPRNVGMPKGKPL